MTQTLDFNKLLTEEQRKTARSVVAKLNKKLLPNFERSGNQRYVAADSEKDPYTGLMSPEAIDGNILTDGKIEKGHDVIRAGAELMQPYSISNYSYIIINTKLGEGLHQSTIVTKDVKLKLYIQHLLNMALG